MSLYSYPARGIYTPTRRTIILILMLMIGIGGTGSAGTARAAPPAQEITNMRFYLNIRYPQTLCAGREYSILVTPLVELDGKRADGQKFNYKDRVISGVEITAEIADKNIAAVDPAKPRSKKSGSLPGHLLNTLPLQGFGRFDEVIFTLHAKKAGTTNLYLTAKVPSQWSGSTARYFGPGGMPSGGPIRIVDCEYHVSMTYRRQDPFGSTTGFMRSTLIKSDGQELTGQGEFIFNEFISIPGCTFSISELKSPTGITANIVDPNASPLTLRLRFDYAEAAKTIITKCGLGALGTASGQETVPEDPDWFLDLPEVYFKEPWGTMKFTTLNGGSMWVTVKPVPSSATK